MNNKMLSTLLATLVVLAAYGTFVLAAPLQAAPSGISTEADLQFAIAPLNPDFVKYQQEAASGKSIGATQEGYALGYAPPSADLGSRIEKTRQFVSVAATPTSYDLRSLGKVTAIRNQGPCGTCWIFAPYASLESYLLTGETRDFSENNVKNLLSSGYADGFDRMACDASGGGVNNGNFIMTTAYLARWSGPVNEADDPYNPSDGGVSPSGLTVQKHVQNVEYLPYDSNYATIKQAIMDHGAVATTIYYYSAYYDPTHYTYYYPGSSYNPNHGITIVGWDDTFDRTLFGGADTPSSNGAFICKNSWGSSWGNNGYFYVSYDDYWIGVDNARVTAEPTSNYDRVYQYDPLGWVGGFGTGSTTTAWGANVFTATTSESLAAVSFYAERSNTQYETYVHVDPTSGTGGGTTYTGPSGTIAFAGYYTIPLTSTISLGAGHKFSVVVKFTTPGYNYPVPIEYPLAGRSSHAAAGAGQSYLSVDGSSWQDAATVKANANVCIKAFTTVGAPTPTPTPTPTGGSDVAWSSVSTLNAMGQKWVVWTMTNTGTGNAWAAPYSNLYDQSTAKVGWIKADYYANGGAAQTAAAYAHLGWGAIPKNGGFCKYYAPVSNSARWAVSAGYVYDVNTAVFSPLPSRVAGV